MDKTIYAFIGMINTGLQVNSKFYENFLRMILYNKKHLVIQDIDIYG